MHVLVTGHRGYVGSVLVPQLRDAGHDVSGLDAGFFADCRLPVEIAKVPERRADVRDVGIEDLRGFDAVVHLAGLSNDPRSYRVDCGKLERAAPGLALESTVRGGVGEIAALCVECGARPEDFEGPRYARLQHLQALRAAGRLDGSLCRVRESEAPRAL